MISSLKQYVDAAVVMTGSYRRRRPFYKQLLADGVSPGSELNIEKIKSSDTLFILGSGGSINEYTEEDWSKISNHDSLGFNWWLLHDFVPTYYGSEAYHKEKFRTLLKMKEEEYQNVPFIWKEVKKRRHTDPSILPQYVRRNLYTFFDIGIAGKNINEIKKSYDIARFIGLADHGYSPKFIFEKRASLSYYMFLAALWGYKNIVLCGVDLSDTGYFFLNEKEKYEAQGLPVPEKQDQQSRDVHKTYDPNEGKATIDKVIKALDESIFQKTGVELYIGSKRSALYPDYPYYF